MIETAIIGAGRIATKLEQDKLRYKPCTHTGALNSVNALYKKPVFQLTGVCDQYPDTLTEFKKSNPDIKYAYQDYRQLLAVQAFDLVIISTWTESHAAIATEAIRSGARAIVLEKPIAMNKRDAQKIAQLAHKFEIPVWVNFERRYHPAYQLIHKYISTKKLGELRSIRGRILTTASRNPADKIGPLLHDGIHWLDLLLWYAGKPDSLSSRIIAASSGAIIEDTTFIDFNYPNFNATLESGGKRNYFEFAIELDFSSGRILAGNTGHRYFKTSRSKRYSNFTELEEFKPKIPTRNPWTELYKEIYKYLRGSNKIHPTTNLDDAVSGMELIHTALSPKRKFRF